MYWTVSATADNEFRVCEDVIGEKELTAAIARIQSLATENNETLVITISPRVHVMVVEPKKESP